MSGFSSAGEVSPGLSAASAVRLEDFQERPIFVEIGASLLTSFPRPLSEEA
jgi:hypothetical protein